jgi:hypothetical protein
MTIEFHCTQCGQKLRVPDEHAGKLARCPQCQLELPVPGGTAPSSPGGNPFAGPMPSSSLRGTGRWYVKTPDGERYGPLDRSELERWRDSGRLNAQCELLEEGWEQWKWADEVFPELAPRMVASSPPPREGPRTPMVSDNPYAATLSSQEPTRRDGSDFRYLKPHRGGLILGMGISNFVFCMLCSFCSLAISIPTIVMAQNDLKEMENGVMDPSGEGITRAGWIMAMIQIVIVVAIVALQLVMVAIQIAAGPQ